MNLFSTFLAAASATPNPQATGAQLGDSGALGGLLQILIFIVPLGLMYVILIMPQRKKEKKAKQLIEGSVVGDRVVTIGGVCGKIINIKDDEVTIESGVDRTKVVFKKWAIKDVVKPISE